MSTERSGRGMPIDQGVHQFELNLCVYLAATLYGDSSFLVSECLLDLELGLNYGVRAYGIPYESLTNIENGQAFVVHVGWYC